MGAAPAGVSRQLDRTRAEGQDVENLQGAGCRLQFVRGQELFGSGSPGLESEGSRERSPRAEPAGEVSQKPAELHAPSPCPGGAAEGVPAPPRHVSLNGVPAGAHPLALVF